MILQTYFGEEDPVVARGEPKTLKFYLSRAHTQNCSQTTLKELNDIMDGEAKPLAFVQGAEEIMGAFSQWYEYFFMAVKIISQMQTWESYLAVLNWIYTLHYRKVKGEETGTH